MRIMTLQLLPRNISSLPNRIHWRILKSAKFPGRTTNMEVEYVKAFYTGILGG
jgi:hypothetical protein